MERTNSERRLLEVSSGEQDLSPNISEFTTIASVSADVAALQQQQQQQQYQLQLQHQQQQQLLLQQQLHQQQQQQQQLYLSPPSYSPPPQSVQFQTASSLQTSHSIVATSQQQTGYQMTVTPSIGQLQPDFQVQKSYFFLFIDVLKQVYHLLHQSFER